MDKIESEFTIYKMKQINQRARSHLTNGRLLLDQVDARSSSYRRYKDLFYMFVQSLGDTNEAQRQLVRRLSMLSVVAEDMESAQVRGEDIDFDCYTRIANSCRRVIEDLGLAEPTKPDPSAALRRIIASAGDDDDAQIISNRERISMRGRKNNVTKFPTSADASDDDDPDDEDSDRWNDDGDEDDDDG